MSALSRSTVEPVRWTGGPDGSLELLDQRALPTQTIYVPCRTARAAAEGIVDMVVRGAPAIGITAAYGLVLAARECVGSPPEAFEGELEHMAEARPTAVNLRWAVTRMRQALAGLEGNARVERAFVEARAIFDEDLAANHAMGDFGAALLPDGARMLTICNTGSLATSGWGTALGILRSAWQQGRLKHVYACETRPYLQGARLTMWELMQDGIPATLVTDSMAAYLMQQGMVDGVVAGADRIAANGDTANKIGTYALAVLARHHGLPFYIAAPTSTLDLATATGAGIPIEQRSASEVVMVRDVRIAPDGATALHPAFDVTPGELITGIVTERGVARAPYSRSLEAMR